jgi:dipeptidyl aminopeptidase/acylaminoacyl peptidase
VAAWAQGRQADYERAATLAKRTDGKVFRTKVTPHWQPGTATFWYRINTGPGASEVVQVDAERGSRTVVKDPAQITAITAQGPIQPENEPRPSRNGGGETKIRFRNSSTETIRIFWLDFNGARKPYGELKPGATYEQNTFDGHVWLVEGETGQTLGVFEAVEGAGDVVIDGVPIPAAVPAQGPGSGPEWQPFLREFNVWVRNRDSKQEVQLSHDGNAANPYRDPLRLSPNGQKVVAMQIRRAKERKVYVIESSPEDQLQPKLLSFAYAKPGDDIDLARPRLFDIPHRAAIPVSEEAFSNPWSIVGLRWFPDSRGFAFIYTQRGNQVQRVVSVDAASGKVSVLVDETSATFVDYSQKTWLKWLDRTGEFLWSSERDGWNHLYLCDAESGKIKRQITKGEWVVREVMQVDEERRRIWFKAFGLRPGEDPYQAQLARVNFDGTGLTLLTEGDGSHEWQLSPDGRWLIDRWSRPDLPPVTVLRRAEDGALVCELERSDAAGLVAAGWTMPEPFAAAGRDGKTQIYGLIYRPSNFDPNRKYPIIEKIYAGPHDFFVPKTWNREIQAHALAELGFIVVQIDGMGTNWRSRAFHDVCWKNLADAGFPDRIAWLKAAAAVHKELDLGRVGIFGGSAGGQNALGALLFHGDFYKAAAADCGCHDNRMDKIWWNEAWMGWPIGPEYAASSNVVNAGKLTGKLLLTVGELDHNVDPASTMQVVNALIKADKDFELLVIPGKDHGAGETPYAARRRSDFFVRHLLGVEPRSM